MLQEDVLQNFGLTKAEAQLYLTLLMMGEATAAELAHKTNTNRTFTYDRLKKLLNSGLVSHVIKDNKKYFKAAEPSQLLAILKEKEEQVREILPELENMKVPPQKGPQVSIFSSKKGVRTALNEMLRDRKTAYVYGSIKRFNQVMGSFYDIWNTRRVKERIPLKILSNEEVHLDLAESDTLPEEEQSSGTTFTFGHKIITILWSDIPVAILIDSEEIAADNLAFFNAIWEREIKIYSGVDGIHKAFYELISRRTKFHYGIGYSFDLAQVYGIKMSDDWQEKRIQQKITSHLISYNDSPSRVYFRDRMKRWKDFNIKFLEREFCGPACITFSEHMIVTFIYTEKKFKVIVNKNKETIAVYKKHFETLWKLAKK